jgi:acyl transferase domain-containing protein/thioesterase domain-containing protein
MSDEDMNDNTIAIVGMALRVPGANTPNEYWKNLYEGRESMERLDEQTLLDSGESPELIRNPAYVPVAGSLEGVKLFDREFFGFSPKEAAILDPQHRHFTELCWEALEDAGHTPERFDGQIGLFGGCGMGSYFYFNVCSHRELVDSVGLFLLRHTGNDKDFLSTRVSYTLDLRGPSVNVQTACSTSLVATHLACQSLLSGESDLALAGGSTILFPQDRGYLHKAGEVMSPTGHCHAFDHRAEGTVLSSGAGVVALRRLEDALADGDPIYALIKGSAVNNDGGRKVGYLAPSVDGQMAAMTEAYAVADIDPRTIGYIECHGTGTYMGDPIEVSALTQAFRQTTDENGFCRLASVKTNIGHLDTAAGVAGLIKAALSLQEETIPASLNFEKANPVIGFEDTPFVVNNERTEWPRTNEPRRAAVNSLGVGGTNAHVVLEEAPRETPSLPSSRPFQLIQLSAKNKKSLDGNGERLAKYLRANPDVDLADVSYSLERGRRAMERRRVLVARDGEEASELLEGGDPRRVFSHVVPDVQASVVLMFSGGGSQYAGMARDLHEAEPVFREHLDRGLDQLQQRTGVDFRSFFFFEEADRERAEEGLEPPSRALSAIFIVEYAMVKLLQSWGVEPDIMIGHSMGEVTAACVAGVIAFEDALDWMQTRGQVADKADPGMMLSVALPEGDLRGYLTGGCEIAAVNAPGLCVASGTIEEIDDLAKRLEEADIDIVRLATGRRAGHSRLFDPVIHEFRDFVARLDLKAPQIPIISNRTGKPLTDSEATDPEYWVQHLRHTVYFSKGIETVLQVPGRLLIEVGPGQALCSFTRQHAGAGQGANVVPSMRHRADPSPDSAYFLATLGRLWASGLDLDLARLYEGETRRRVRLPTYAWDHHSYFIDAIAPQAPAEERSQLERIEDITDWGRRPVWRAEELAAKESRSPETWLIFMDHAGLGQRLAKRLRARGHRVLEVHEGDAYHKRSEDQYTLAPELGRAGYDALIQDLVSTGNVPTQIVHLWLVTATERFRPGASFFHQNIQDGFYSLYFLAKGIGDESVPTPLHLSVVSNGVQSVFSGDGPLHPEKATVLGPVQVIPRELEGVTCKSIDLHLPSRPSEFVAGMVDGLRRLTGRSQALGLDEIADTLEAELLAPAESDIVAHRGNDRFVRRYERQPLTERAPGEPSVLSEGATYLITGGLGGLGLALADRLARELRPKLVLVGRTPLPERAEWDGWLESHAATETTSRRILKIRALEEAGAEVCVVVADVTHLDAMRVELRAVTERWGKIDGIFHTAGLVKDELIQLKRDVEIEEVFAPKVHGTIVLDALLKELGTKLLVLYSSTSAIASPAGQIDYVAANAFLDAYAHSRAGGPVRTLAINWGIWNDIGMAAANLGGSEEDDEDDRIVPVDYPLFDTRQKDSHGRTVFEKVYSPQRDWVLDEHRTKAMEALLPGTCYPELARAALAEYGEKGAFELRDLYFIRPVSVPDGEVRNVRVALQPSERGYRFEVRTRCRVDGRVGWELNVESQIELGHVNRPAPIDVEAIDKRCRESRSSVNPNGHRSGQEEHATFGPRWRVMREVLYGRGEALARMELPEAFHDDLEAFRLHPALLDYATGYAMELIEGYDPDDSLWIPVSYGRLAVHDRLPARFSSWVKLRSGNAAESDFAVFDVSLIDESGQVVVEVEEFTIKRLGGPVDLSVANEPSRPNVEFETSIARGEDHDASPGERQLRRNFERGILAEEGTEALFRALAGEARPQIAIGSLDLEGLIRQTEEMMERASGSETRFERPELNSEYVEPRDEIERTLVGIWEELLGVDKLGVQDDFFDLGGHSLIAVRLFATVKKAYSADFPISVLFEAPTIEGCAALIREATGQAGGDDAESNAPTQKVRRTRFKHLVAMDARAGEGSSKAPFFLVAGMFGNVLNLRHLANLVGTDRAFYGLQARGLYGDEPPHETFEEMAAAYLEEVRQVQPEGPYYIGGFSGGGITAFEMAHQLRAAGEKVGLLVMLDSMIPTWPDLTKLDRLKVQWQRIKRQGPRYFFEWARNRARWELERIQTRLYGDGAPERSEDQFHNEAVEAAFRAALPRYPMRRYPGHTVLFRPKLDEAYVLGPNRILNSAKLWVWPDNGWGEWVDSIDILEMPGNHDSMVLEPNVRVLANRLRACVAEVEAQGPRMIAASPSDSSEPFDATEGN